MAVIDTEFLGGGTGVLDGHDAVLFRQRQDPLNPPHRHLSLLLMHGVTEGSDLGTDARGMKQ